MAKRDFIRELQEAKAAHMKWVEYAKSLAQGEDAGSEKLPQKHTACQFGKWYYGRGGFLKFISEYKKIEPIHTELHDLYNEIFDKYLTPEKKGLFVNAAKAKAEKKADMDVAVQKLTNISESLLDMLTVIQNQIQSMGEDELKAIFLKS